jgi:DNA-binding transcriptional regulator/RsmH inhibitor MraZ
MEKIHTSVNQKKRKKLEFYFSANAEKMSLDGQGRLLLNEELRKKVELLDQKEAEVFGNNKRIEIWNRDLFYEQLDGIDEEEVEDILDEFGI